MKKYLLLLIFCFLLLECRIPVFSGYNESKIITESLIRDIFDLSENQELIESEYEIQPGDWLLKIAEKKYGDGSLWEAIALFNPEISNPNLISPGDVIRVPKIIEIEPEVIKKPVEDPVETEMPDILEIANFNSGFEENLLGGAFGVWDKDPDDITQSCRMEFERNITSTGYGYSLKLIYDVNSPNPAYNGFWMHLLGADFTPYSFLYLSVKGEPDAGFTDRFKIELKDTEGVSESFMLDGITARWQEKRIPLAFFKNIDMSSAGEFVVVFEDQVSSPKTGIIYLDNIYVK